MKLVLSKTQGITSKTKQSGLSLIELLIAMIIGLFLLVGITSSYLSSKKSSIIRDEYSILEDNGRLALEVLTKTLEHTGYTSSNSIPLSDKFISARTDIKSAACDGGQSVMNKDIFPSTVTEDNRSGDSIGIIYLADNNIFTDCSGGELPATCQIGSGLSVDASKIYNAFFLDTTDNTLQCAGSRNNEKQLIAEGIENIQILYGVANDNNRIERYVKASDVGNLWNNVVSVQVAVLARTLKEIKDKAEIQKFTLLDFEHTTLSDRYHRAVFSTTISLRNSLE